MSHAVQTEQATTLLLQGCSAEAVQVYSQIPAQHRSPSVWSNLGLAHQQTGDLNAALDCIGQALALLPEFTDAWYNRGVTLNHLGRNKEAKAAYEKVLALQPAHVHARLNLGICLATLREPKAALEYLRQVLAGQPDIALAWYWQGMALAELCDWAGALASFEASRRLQPDHHDTLIELGYTHLKLAQFQQALEVLEQALVLDPNAFGSHYYLGNALRELNRWPEAIAAYERALSIEPNSVEALANKGVCYERMHDFENALYHYEQVLALEPSNPVGLFNSGNALADLGRNHEAIARYEQLTAIDNTLLGRRVNAAFCYLKLGDFERGWPLYEGRWENPHPADNFHFDVPLWLGETSLQGKRILLMCEQGFGDTIQFSRYVRQVKELGAYVILCVQEPLFSLLGSLKDVDELIAKGQELPAIDCYCPLLSLPLAFKTTAQSVDGTVPYLSADFDKSEKWRNILAPGPKPIVGLAWQGNTQHKYDFRRSIALSELAPLFAQSDAFDFVVLQTELSAVDHEILAHYPQVKVLPKRTDFAETAALISAVDIVVTVDTAVGHLAGALGKVTWLLLAFVTDWRWTVGKTRTPWYPHTQLFWQNRAGDWTSTVISLEESLRGWGKP